MKFYQRKMFKFTVIGMMVLIASINVCFSQSKTEQLDKLLNLYHEYGQFNGSVLVAEQGEVIYKKGFGMANMEWDIPNEPNTKHRLGSITKQFTAMLILQLVADGAVDLEAPITSYLPDYPKETGDQITIHHLLTHTSGIPNYTSFPNFFKEESRNPYTPDEFVEVFAHKKLDFAPGERFSYSNSGYFLLGVVAEKLTGKTYEQLLHDNIFTPAGMNDTGYDNHEDIVKNRATGYEKDGLGYVNASYLDMSIPYAAGSMYSTVEDLYLWDQALYTDKLLPQALLDLYFKPYISAFGDSHYAYGWGVGKEMIGNTEDSVEAISHGGGINGFNTNISRVTSDKSLVVLLNNTGGAALNEITSAIRGILYNKTYDFPKKSVANEVLGIVQEKGIEAGIAHFHTIKDKDTYNLSEDEINGIGYQLMGAGKTEEALQIFKLNVDEFPKGFNVYDSYAEALMNLGQNDAAIENYRKSVEMNPANQNGIDMLEKLGVDISDLVEEVIVPDDLLKSYVGKYELAPGFILTVTKEGSQLKAQATGQPAFDIYPKSNTVFYLKVVTAQVTFNTAKDGTIESLTLLQGGREMTGMKM